MDDLSTLGAGALADAAARGLATAAGVAIACLDRIRARDDLIRAWTCVDEPTVLAAAHQLDMAAAKGPLYGIAVGVKDVIHTRDMPTRHNSPLYADALATGDAAAVATLRAAGALILGKTDTVEFASTGRKARTRNPHDVSRTPGGSSSGSAAAVADFHVPIALGTQTGGSMIRPASFCGVFAIKPTWGLVSTEGAKSFAPTLDTLGWFARSVEDLSLLYDVFDPEPAVEPPLHLAKARIALCRSPFWSHAEPATRHAMDRAERALRHAGASVTVLDLPPLFDCLGHAHGVIMASEGRSAFLSEHRQHGDGLHPNIRAYVENTAGWTRGDLKFAYDAAARARIVFDDIAAAYDAVLTPSVVGEAPLGLAETGSMVFNAMWTLLHAPCVNLPGFTGPAGMPVGLTVTGPRFADRRVLAASAAMSACFAGGA